MEVGRAAERDPRERNAVGAGRETRLLALEQQRRRARRELRSREQAVAREGEEQNIVARVADLAVLAGREVQRLECELRPALRRDLPLLG